MLLRKHAFNGENAIIIAGNLICGTVHSQQVQYG